MAMKLNAGDVTRLDLSLIYPEEIVTAWNGRFDEPDPADVATLVRSFEELGQKTPCIGRRIADNKVELVAGYRRLWAAKQYNEKHPDKRMKLAIKVGIMNDEEALRCKVAENHERKDQNPMDDALQQREFRDRYGWTDTRIAEEYHYSPAYVGQLKKLLMLPRDLQAKVASRELSVQAAIALTDLSAEEQAAVLQPVTPTVNDTPAPVTSGEIIKRVRNKKIEKGGKQARSLKELKDFLEGLTGPADPLKVFAETMLKFIGGTYTDATMEKKLKAMVTGKEEEVPGLEATTAPEVTSLVTTPEVADNGSGTESMEVLPSAETVTPEAQESDVLTLSAPVVLAEAA